MFVQEYYKGISGLGPLDIASIFRTGILSNNLRSNPNAPLVTLLPMLSEPALYGHVTDYATYGANSPFVSLTAGTRNLANAGGAFRPFRAWETAVRFATRNGKTGGVVFEGWVITLGVPSWHISGVAEDIRDHHSYPRFNAFWKQGEVTAKLLVPPMQVVRATILDLSGTPTRTLTNPTAIPAAQLSNIRKAI
ncbi:hypothetical protein [Cellulomonas denverensis]|uniref:Uncharacterized protein n=1 Tax=Cellulomonas denverensis TaxID=264297 RepID=A0A7X6QYK3_9CELL|nr:hypothetical protein [Cellulomonas denverensis]NKY22240.1 hypothetical protein [Cellulomonas denverensis]GIG26904.1 hypothetical protein Cde04nite_31480 [Cellulomonas denverensis]